jgi:hypothetical protein
MTVDIPRFRTAGTLIFEFETNRGIPGEKEKPLGFHAALGARNKSALQITPPML